MAERTKGIYALVTIPALYEAFQDILGGRKARETFERDYFAGFAGKRILEVGCGPGTWVPQLANASSYIGVDWNQAHIDQARETYGSSTINFICGDVATDQGLPEHSFDKVCAFGLLHHLDDIQANDLLNSVERMLMEGGKFLAIEPVYHPNQHWFARWMKDRDSGQNIRTEQTYLDLLRPHFKSTVANIHTDMLRIPYSHCVLQATR